MNSFFEKQMKFNVYNRNIIYFSILKNIIFILSAKNVLKTNEYCILKTGGVKLWLADIINFLKSIINLHGNQLIFGISKKGIAPD